MPVQLNHTIVHATDPDASAAFVTELLGLAAPAHYGPFTVVQTDNDVSLDYLRDTGGDFDRQHYCFLVSEDEFDAILGRIQARDLQIWADPRRSRPGQINHNDGGRGVYWQDPDGHLLEIITRPYGSGGA